MAKLGDWKLLRFLGLGYWSAEARSLSATAVRMGGPGLPSSSDDADTGPGAGYDVATLRWAVTPLIPETEWDRAGGGETRDMEGESQTDGSRWQSG